MMGLLSSFLSALILAAKRLWSQRTLMLCLLAGLVAAVGLLSSIPLYADAVHHRLLQGELIEAGTRCPPFAFLWRYVGAWHGDVGWDSYVRADEYLSGPAASAIGLPLEFQVRHVRTANLHLFAAEGGVDREPLLWTSLGFISGLEDHVELLEGSFPTAGAPGEDVPVLVSQALAEKMGLQVGERYVLFGGQGRAAVQIPVQIVGVWRPRDPSEPFWFYQLKSFDEALLTAEPAFVAQVVPALETPVSTAVWYQVYGGSGVRSADVGGLLGRIATAQSRATALLANTNLDASPAEALQSYRQAAGRLTATLSLFSVPVVGLILYFISLVAGMVVHRSQGEIAILRSRGTTRGQVLLVHLLEGLLVGAAGLAGGLALGAWLAQGMGRVRTFLDPALLGASALAVDPLPIVLSPTALEYGLLGVGLAVLVLLLQAVEASRHTIVTYKWERARALLAPWWQRALLDLLLLVPLAYGLYILRRQGTLLGLGSSGDPFSNPLLFLVPALFCFALGLLFARVFPWLMGALAWLANALPGAAPILTLRQLARSARQYTGPLLLLGLTLSLATFSASIALTLDGQLQDQVYYQVGADLRLVEPGEGNPELQPPGQPGQPAVPVQPIEGPRWFFLPVSEHLRVPGVRAAARVGDYTATANVGGRPEVGRILGLDRTDFPAVACFRPDFAAGESLGGLMNRLAMDPANLLASRGFLERHGMAVGDPLRLTVSAAGESQELDFIVAGVLDLFPTVYPQDGPFFVANLEYLYEGLGDTFPYDVWLATGPSVPPEEIVSGVRDLGVTVVAATDARATIAAEQTRPERQGLFGLLSVGFLAAAALTVLGFLVYAVVSFQRRFVELGILRAVGLSVGQMAGHLAGEQALLILIGAGLGTGLGAWASRLFIPYLQVGTGKAAQIVPFTVQVAWERLWTIYAVFGAMLVVAVAVLGGLLGRMKLFEAIKLGEAG
jgi:putative ABC transport system permease protein